MHADTRGMLYKSAAGLGDFHGFCVLVLAESLKVMCMCNCTCMCREESYFQAAIAISIRQGRVCGQIACVKLLVRQTDIGVCQALVRQTSGFVKLW